MIKKFFILIILSLSAITAWPQVGDSNNAKIFSARDFCSSYEVDARIVGNIDALNAIMDSLQGVEPNAYPIMSQWCRRQRLRMTRMINSLRNDYTWDGDIVWLDSTHTIVDAGSYIASMEHTMALLQTRSTNYEQLEEERLQAEKVAQAEARRAEEQRIQRQKDIELQEVKDTIKELHRSITSICDARGITDKARIKELKDLYYAYLAVYNRYDLSSNKTDNTRFAQLSELRNFQVEMMDSVLGDNSFAQRISNFSNTLKIKTGKNHSDIYKSYQKCIKRMQIPIGFKNIAEYRVYISRQREVQQVQQSFLSAIDLRDSIILLSNTLQQLCSRKHRDIYTSFREIMAEFNTVPSYTTVAESQKFTNNLRDFIQLEEEYIKVVYRVDIIDARGDSIVALCSKGLTDVATAYKELVTMSDFVPHFINIASAEHYNKTLDNFEKVQECYITLIGLRRTIAQNAARLQAEKNMPRAISMGYRQLAHNTDFTPHFSNIKGGKDFIKSLNHFIDIQDIFSKIAEHNRTIEANSKTIKMAFKDFGNLYRAYTKLIDSYNYEVVIISENDLNTYRNYQASILNTQSVFMELVNSMEKEDYNRRLKKVRDLEKIKLIMGVK